MRILHLIKSVPWPLHGGRQINAHHQMHAAIARGHDVHVALLKTSENDTTSDWPLHDKVTIHHLTPHTRCKTNLTDTADHSPSAATHDDSDARSARWNAYWGNEPWIPSAVDALVDLIQPDYIEACGLDVLPWLSPRRSAIPRLWLAADDACLHNLTLVRTAEHFTGKIEALRNSVTMAIYERNFANRVDAAIAVSAADARALRIYGGFKHVLTTPNGVDHDYFAFTENPGEDRTAIFWGRLDFQPNITALDWFVKNVWFGLHKRHPDAQFRIIGKNPGMEVKKLAHVPGVELIGEVNDIRPWAQRSRVVVLPMQSGAGIKNKLLEATSMGRAIVATPRTVKGLTAPLAPQPWSVASNAQSFADQIVALWGNVDAARELGLRARQWVTASHNWMDGALQREAFVQSFTSACSRRKAA